MSVRDRLARYRVMQAQGGAPAESTRAVQSIPRPPGIAPQDTDAAVNAAVAARTGVPVANQPPVGGPLQGFGRVGAQALRVAGPWAGGSLGFAAGGPLGIPFGAAGGGAGGEELAQRLEMATGLRNAMDEGAVDASGLTAGAFGLIPGGIAGIPGATRLAGKVASFPVLRNLPGASIARRVAADLPEVVPALKSAFGIGSKGASNAAAVENQLAAIKNAPPGAVDMQPLVGRAGAQAFREGGQAALDAQRVAAATAGETATQAAGQTAGQEVPKGMHVVVQKAGAFLRKNAKPSKSGPPGTGKPKLKIVGPGKAKRAPQAKKPSGPPGTGRLTAKEKAAEIGPNRAPRRSLAANESTGGQIEIGNDLAQNQALYEAAARAGIQDPINVFGRLAAKGFNINEIDPATMTQFLQMARAQGLIP